MRVAFAVMLPWLTLAGGCVLIPTPAYKSDGLPTRQNVSTKDAQQIQTGVTSREEVLLRFGEPDATFGEGRRFVYLWGDVIAWFFAGAGYSATGGEISRGSMLEVDFDPSGIVCRREVRTPALSDIFTTQNIRGVVYAPLRAAPEP
jgi:outer membrane protein assembly factor BamE (lipoprotein component of BamABCDE complex)